MLEILRLHIQLQSKDDLSVIIINSKSEFFHDIHFISFRDWDFCVDIVEHLNTINLDVQSGIWCYRKNAFFHANDILGMPVSNAVFSPAMSLTLTEQV